MDMTSEMDQAPTTFNRAFAAGDTEPFVGLFAEGTRVLLQEHPALVRRDDIGQMFIELVAMVDTAGFEVDYVIVDFHDDRAYFLATFRDTLRPKDGAPCNLVVGRLVCFWRREEDGTWQVSRLLTGPASADRILS